MKNATQNHPMLRRWQAVALLGATLALAAAAQTAAPAEFTRMPVIDILRNPPAASTKVETYGTVRQNVRAQAGVASIYMLEGDEGGTIEVQANAATPPIPNTRFDSLRGIVQYKTGTDGQPTPYLMEVPQPIIIEDNRGGGSLLEKYLPHLLLLGGVVVLGVFVLFFLKLRQPPSAHVSVLAAGGPVGEADKTIAGSISAAAVDDEITIRRDQTTVRLSEVTRVFFPGHLVIKGGGEAGKKIPLCSSAGGGTRVTIGRRSSAGGGAFIGLDDPSRALSRNQAVVVYDKSAGHILLENQQASNPTTVDGRPLGGGETVTLKPGMTVGFPPEFAFEFREGPAYQA